MDPFQRKRFTTKHYRTCFNNERKWGVDGPGSGLGQYAGFLNEHLNCDSEVEAERAASIADIAYACGYSSAQYVIRKAMGVQE